VDARKGSLEVDQTLQLARDAVERDIARYRVIVFAAVAALTATLRALHVTGLWGPSAFFGGALVYAIGIWAHLVRFGNPAPLAVIALILDLCTCLAPLHLARTADPTMSAATNLQFVPYIVGPAMVLTLLINSLRNSTATALVGSGAAVALYLATVPPSLGFHPGQLSVSLILVLAGLIGVASAIQARKSLDAFARLQLLRRYLPPEAVERVMRGDPDAALSPGGRLVTVTLLAADLRGFTAMSDKLSPTEVMAELNAYHAVMIDVIERHGGVIDKFIGDGTLVVFGLTGRPEDAAVAAVACAGAMLDALVPHNEERARAGALPLAMGVGVHTGPVIAGNLGVPGHRLEFTVIGDAVNTVARLEGQTKEAKTPVIISATTAALLPNTSYLKELAPVTLRGKAAAIGIFGLDQGPESSARRRAAFGERVAPAQSG
jgi:adenylate cyclase